MQWFNAKDNLPKEHGVYPVKMKTDEMPYGEAFWDGRWRAHGNKKLLGEVLYWSDLFYIAAINTNESKG